MIKTRYGELISIKIMSEGILSILVDSKSLSESYADNPESLNFLRYADCDFFDVRRTPVKTGLEIIDTLPTFKEKIDKSKNRGSIECTIKNELRRVEITNKFSDVDIVAKEFFQKEGITENEQQKIWYIFVYAELYHTSGSNIYITTDDAVLKNRSYFWDYPLNKPVNIVTVEEGKEIMDLFAKNLGNYLIGHKSVSVDDYYWISFISKVPHYRSPTKYNISDTDTVPWHVLAVRFRYLLKCVDNMGMGYYHGNDKDEISGIRFHFNYFMILAAGILDILAAATKKKYKIDAKDKLPPHKISLNNRSGEEFIEMIKEKNPDLHRHIKSNDKFIDMIYKFRNPIVHGDFRDKKKKKRNNIYYSRVRIDSDIIRQALSCLENENPRYDKYSDWGRVKISDGEYVWMYVFSKKLALHLADFVDRYLDKIKLRGYRVHPAVRDKRMVGQFQEEKLGL